MRKKKVEQQEVETPPEQQVRAEAMRLAQQVEEELKRHLIQASETLVHHIASLAGYLHIQKTMIHHIQVLYDTPGGSALAAPHVKALSNIAYEAMETLKSVLVFTAHLSTGLNVLKAKAGAYKTNKIINPNYCSWDTEKKGSEVF